ncbi:ADP-heptose synthase / D-glycero-beta-D-manno-heptose 7-phosphate kinase [hydrothermal vent metagenome]|uniref:D-glycero-beta-D-manno-heptose 1-phosphate adenylyltransferase n=1 Tax=hydrothermal vent metagenome TaxID=652676 RepID=A0A1W1EL66_9ZZZZ
MSKKVLVIGDVMLDHYLWGSCSRISPEAPVPIVEVSRESTILGGCGNVVNNLQALGCSVGLISVVGDDNIAIEIEDLLNDTTHYIIKEKSRKTSKKSRIIASHQQVIRYDNESINDISLESQLLIIDKLKTIIDDYQIIILSDYAKGVLTDKLTKEIISMANGKKVLIDPKGDNYDKYRGAYLITPNKSEAKKVTNIEIIDNHTLGESLNILSSIVEVPLITLSEDGIALLQDGRVITKPTVSREVYDVTGAGDTVIASIAYSLMNNKNIVESIEFANLVAGVVVGKIGSATASLEEIEEYKSSLHKSKIESHIKDFSQISKVVERLKKLNKKIVFTNGCFDILHRGHVSYLDTAKSYGDILILGLNSDDSIKRLKGENRPINTQDDRAYILAGLESVDFVVPFSDDTPYKLIQLIEPDILVKGGDYHNKEVVGSDIAKEVRLVDFIDGKSTTKTIEKIICGE